jgi:hypothetical protein
VKLRAFLFIFLILSIFETSSSLADSLFLLLRRQKTALKHSNLPTKEKKEAFVARVFSSAGSA